MNILKKTAVFGLAIAASGTFAQAALPKASSLVEPMGLGFNIGNSMDVPNNPTAWGNPFPSQDLMDSIKAAGFSTVRIPCAWDSHASGGVINSSWLDSVKTVVDYAISANLYVILNIHHEGNGGWFQTHIGTSVDDNVNTKLNNYWTQIATKFKDYDEHLLFAGANEPGSNIGDGNMTQAHVNTLMSYYQTFVNAVRATGGNNETRTLIIQGPNTNIDNSVKFATTNLFPTDKDNQQGYLMFEVHYYDPYQYTLMGTPQNWGADEEILPQYYYGADFIGADPKRNAGYNAWAHSVDQNYYTNAHVETQFSNMKSSFTDKGYPVIIGEYGANIRTPDLTCDDLKRHMNGRVLWHKDVATAAKKYGHVPVLWDMGNEKDEYDNMAYIRRQSSYGTVGAIVDLDVINALREVYGLSAIQGTSLIEKKTQGCSSSGNNPEGQSGGNPEGQSGGNPEGKSEGNPDNQSTTIAKATSISQNVHLSVENGMVTASFNANTAGRTTISLMNSLGQVIASKDMNAARGTNSVSLKASYQGTAFLVIRQGSQKMVKAIRLK